MRYVAANRISVFGGVLYGGSGSIRRYNLNLGVRYYVSSNFGIGMQYYNARVDVSNDGSPDELKYTKSSVGPLLLLQF